MISIFQIYFDENTRTLLDPAFFPYMNESKDEYFENKVIREIYEMNSRFKKGMSYMGVSSWKQFEKTHITGKEIIARIKKDTELGIEKDVYLFPGVFPEVKTEARSGEIFGTIAGMDMFSGHKSRCEQLHIDDARLNDSGVLPVNLFDGKWNYSSCNYWAAKTHVFDDYCRNWLMPAMDFFKTIEHTMPKHHLHESGGQTRYVTSICFALEALFGSFLAHSNYSFEYLCKRKIRRSESGNRKYHWVRIEKFENTELNSQLAVGSSQ